MPYRIKVENQARCIGCYSCMFACSRANLGSISLRGSAINILTAGGIESNFTVVVCRACLDPPCARVCPVDAIVKRDGGGVTYNKDICIGCRECAKACLVHAIQLDNTGKPTFICIHCGVCAKFCPHEVLALRKL